MSVRVEQDLPGMDAPVSSAPSSMLRATLIALIAIAALVIAGGAGWLLRGDGSASADAGPSAVDVGFAQDMITHHIQAVTMAGIERDDTADGKLRVLAYDIESGQGNQVGQMTGWLAVWNKPIYSEHQMSWMGGGHMSMGSGDLMPGMATPAQMDQLGTLRGRALDTLFLQLMIHHHQGGIPMARYAAQHGKSPQVVALATKMVTLQSNEIIEMERLLRQLGGSPLPPPA